jgi:hypothetical protein
MRPATLALASCVTGPGEGGALPLADYEAFTAEVQPVLAARCSNPSCHGEAGRPFELYAEHMHRIDPEDVWRDTPLTGAELWLNFQRTCALLVGVSTPEDCPLLTKPLATEAGGAEHEGGAQFLDMADPEYEALYEWVAAALLEEGP